MGAINFHPWVQSVTGRYGRVFTRRLRNGKVITVMPRSAPTGPLDPALARIQERFKEGAAYSKLLLGHPARRAPYEARAEEKHTSAYVEMMAEFLKNPLIRLVDTSAYHGQVGNTIDVRGREDLIALVQVMLLGEGEAELDAGEATVLGGAWRFTAGIAIPLGTPITVKVTVTDNSNLELERRIPLVVA